jgi:hypothetical protein
MMMTDDPAVVVLRQFFQAVSFEEGGQPAYPRLHDLFIDGGKLIAAVGPAPEVTGVDEFIAPRQRAVASGELTWFEEVEIDGVTVAFGDVAHRFSRYSKAGRRGGEGFTCRGMISTQFVHTPHGWRISSMAWDDERPGLAVPASAADPTRAAAGPGPHP